MGYKWDSGLIVGMGQVWDIYSFYFMRQRWDIGIGVKMGHVERKMNGT